MAKTADPSLGALLKQAQSRLGEGLALDARDAALEARYLLQEVLQVDRAWLIAHQDDALQPNIHAEFQALLERRLDGEPVAHIVGHREFYGLDLCVTPDTLIPRPDTETLVEAALARIPANTACSILDLGTGSGAIALAIAAHRPQAQVTAAERSLAALAVAIENAQRLGIDNVRFIESDWFSALGRERFDLIVSNPPYIAANDPHLRQGDLRFEPATALASGQDGLEDIRQIVSQAADRLHAGGWLLLEHGYDQAAKVADLLQQAGFLELQSARDLAGIVRVSGGRR